MAIQRFTRYEEFEAAVQARGLVCYTVPDFTDDPNVDSMWDPIWAVQAGELNLIYTDSPMFGCFQNVPKDPKGKTWESAGFLCDTTEEFEAEMAKSETAHDALAERINIKPTLH